MKVLKKNEAVSEASRKRKEQIDEGISLAQKIDKLRMTLSDLENQHAKFVGGMKEELERNTSALHKKIKDGKEELSILEEKKLKASAPIDLTTEWKKIDIAKREIKILNQELTDRETIVISKEAIVHNLDNREEGIIEKEKSAEHYLEESRKTYSKTEDLRRDMERRKSESDALIDSRLIELDSKESSIISRENEIGIQKDELSKSKKELLDMNSNLVQRESKVESKTRELFDREEKVKEQEALSKRYIAETSKNYDVSENLKREVLKSKEESDREITQRYSVLSVKEKELGYRERDLVLQKEGVENSIKEIEKEKIHIASQQETLRQAWVNIKKLQTNN